MSCLFNLMLMNKKQISALSTFVDNQIYNQLLQIIRSFSTFDVQLLVNPQNMFLKSQ